MKSVTLYYREGRSDKVYQAELAPQDGGWMVRFAYGRRGSTMTTGTKTTNPVSLEDAEKILGKLIQSKTAKGYVTGQDGTPFTAPTTAERSTGITPQLLNPVENVKPLLHDDAWCLQPKHDGRRMLVRKRAQDITGINRRGLVCGLPQTISSAASVFGPDFLIDGEAVGDCLHAFDLLDVGGVSLREKPYRERLAELLNLLASAQQRHIRLVETRFGTVAKRQLFERLVKEKSEGVVFKHLDAPYVSGRPSSGGNQLKHKFVETASVLVTGLNAKRSASLGLYDGERIVPVGNVAIPADQPVPAAGSIVEVRYLYAMPGSNALYQPVCLGTRNDLSPAECTLDQLKHKPEAA